MSTLPLGQEVSYPERYSPELLAPIPRHLSRQALNISDTELPFVGQDIWNVYELSWLNARGLPQVALLRLNIPCTSPNLVESKSLKLYFNSFNQERLDSREALLDRIASDLQKVLGALPALSLLPPTAESLPTTEPEGQCLDERDVDISDYHPEPSLLRTVLDSEAGGEPVRETFYSHLFRSNCPITNQPDWATVVITYEGARIDANSLLKYLVSFRLHNDYHENCVERLFVDIMARCQPRALRVVAHFTRRGGIDINPWRSTAGFEAPEALPRFVRQ